MVAQELGNDLVHHELRQRRRIFEVVILANLVSVGRLGFTLICHRTIGRMLLDELLVFNFLVKVKDGEQYLCHLGPLKQLTLGHFSCALLLLIYLIVDGLNLLLDIADSVVELDAFILHSCVVLVHLRLDLLGLLFKTLATLIQRLILILERVVAVHDVANFVELFGLIFDLLQVRLVLEDGLEPILDAVILQLQYLKFLFFADLLLFELRLGRALISDLLLELLLEPKVLLQVHGELDHTVLDLDVLSTQLLLFVFEIELSTKQQYQLELIMLKIENWSETRDTYALASSFYFSYSSCFWYISRRLLRSFVAGDLDSISSDSAFLSAGFTFSFSLLLILIVTLSDYSLKMYFTFLNF